MAGRTGDDEVEPMIEIGSSTIGAGAKPYLIAEVGINAWTDRRLAKRFIEVAAEAGADAVKFQTHIADAEMVESAMNEVGAGEVYETVRECEWSVEDHEELQSHASENGVAFLSTPFSVEAVEILEAIDVPAIKIGSGELSNRELLARAGETGKPLLVSTGMHTEEEIAEACAFIDDVAADFALFYCVSEYPTTAADFDFGTIDRLRELASVPIGFSDHSTGAEAAKVAIGNGAAMVEKHFTIDRRLPGPDQSVSVEPDTFEDLSSFARLYHETSGQKDGLQGEEAAVKSWAEHSIVASRDIEPGESFSKENLTTKRPGTGIPAREYFTVLDEKAAERIRAGELIADDQIDRETD
ncbi:N-acetylneuraminate synthase family protein [Halovivax limisalsi]|uniref:N-acetylneuraminate synthase family protein n=1 Tax=Halovivax limisalsi TaxID=1453760 RepID=UPI001FFD0959|nr:N-acetylneuraminate synthase family protein [Halovivax limisalsi]